MLRVPHPSGPCFFEIYQLVIQRGSLVSTRKTVWNGLEILSKTQLSIGLLHCGFMFYISTWSRAACIGCPLLFVGINYMIYIPINREHGPISCAPSHFCRGRTRESPTTTSKSDRGLWQICGCQMDWHWTKMVDVCGCRDMIGSVNVSMYFAMGEFSRCHTR